MTGLDLGSVGLNRRHYDSCTDLDEIAEALASDFDLDEDRSTLVERGREERRKVSHNNSATLIPISVDASKRDFIKKAAYAAPVILSLQAYSALAKAGSTNTVGTPGTAQEQRRDQVKKVLCELQNRSRARRGLPPRSC